MRHHAQLLQNVARAVIVVLGTASVAACDRDRAASDTAGDSLARSAVSADSAAEPVASTADAWTLSAHGYGPVRVGMTVDEARAALGGALDAPDATMPECTYVRSDATPEGVLFMVVAGRIMRVETRTRIVRTDAGAGIGDKEASVLQQYGPDVRIEPHKYTDGRYLIVAPDSASRLVFETGDDTVTTMRGGSLPMVLWVEGCS